MLNYLTALAGIFLLTVGFIIALGIVCPGWMEHVAKLDEEEETNAN